MLFISSKLIHPCFRTTHPLFSTCLSKLIFLQVNSHKIDTLCATKAVMTHKCRGSIVAFSISKSVEPNEEQKVLRLEQGFPMNTGK